MKVAGKAFVLGIALALASTAGCSDDHQPPPPTHGNTGSVGMRLQVGSLTVNTVNYTITNGTNTYVGVLHVADAAQPVAVIGGIQAGTGYVLTLSATATNGTSCTGQSSPFTVIANATVIVGIQLLCRLTNEAGSVKIEGTIAECAGFGSVSAAVPMGNTIEIFVSTVPAVPMPAVSFAWTGGNPGGLSATNVANPVYTCNGTEGQVDLDVTISQANAQACTQTFHLIMDCPPDDNGIQGP